MVLGMIMGAAVWSWNFSDYGGRSEGAKKKTTALLLKSVKTGLSLYNNDIGHYPTEEEGGLRALCIKPDFSDEKTAEKWNGPYLEEEPRDAWGNNLNYQLTPFGTLENQHSPYKLWSNGPDGMAWTADDINVEAMP